MNNANYFFYIYTYIPGWPFIVMYSFLSPYGCCAPCVCVVFCLCPALRVFVSLASRARWLLRWMDASLLLPTPVTGWGGFVAYAAPQAFFIFFFYYFAFYVLLAYRCKSHTRCPCFALLCRALPRPKLTHSNRSLQSKGRFVREHFFPRFMTLGAGILNLYASSNSWAPVPAGEK